MEEPQRTVRPLDSRRYRELANKLRGIARQSSVPDARQKILNLASWYDVRANHLDTRSPPEEFAAEDPC
jgi:hypothetical protein